MKAEQCDTVFMASANSVAPEVSVNLVLLFLSRYFAIFPGLPSPYLHITMKKNTISLWPRQGLSQKTAVSETHNPFVNRYIPYIIPEYQIGIESYLRIHKTQWGTQRLYESNLIVSKSTLYLNLVSLMIFPFSGISVVHRRLRLSVAHIDYREMLNQGGKTSG